MVWVAGIVILILLIISAKFRKFFGVLVLASATGGFLYWQYEKHEEEQSKSRISPSELFFEGVSLNSSYGSYNIVGRITNNSDKYTLNEVQLKITFRDCDKGTQKNCIIIAQNNETIYINIPPKQARDFKEGVYLNSDVHFKGEMVWDYSIESTEAK